MKKFWLDVGFTIWFVFSIQLVVMGLESDEWWRFVFNFPAIFLGLTIVKKLWPEDRD